MKTGLTILNNIFDDVCEIKVCDNFLEYIRVHNGPSTTLINYLKSFDDFEINMEYRNSAFSMHDKRWWREKNNYETDLSMFKDEKEAIRIISKRGFVVMETNSKKEYYGGYSKTAPIFYNVNEDKADFYVKELDEEISNENIERGSYTFDHGLLTMTFPKRDGPTVTTDYNTFRIDGKYNNKLIDELLENSIIGREAIMKNKESIAEFLSCQREKI